MKIAKAFSVIILVLLKTQGVLSEKKEEGRRLFIKRTERSSSKLRKEGDKSVRKRLAISDDPGEPPMSLLEMEQQIYENRNGELGHSCLDDSECLWTYTCDHHFCGGRDNGVVCFNDNECRPGVSCAGKSYGYGYCEGGWNTANCNHDEQCINICVDGFCGRAAEDGESCSEDRECINQCLGNICMLSVGIGGTCTSSPQCQENLVCRSSTCVLLRYPGQSCSAPNMPCGGGQQCSSGRCSGRNHRDKCNSKYQCNSRSCRDGRCSSKPLNVSALHRCEGDCNIDKDCTGSFICFQRIGYASVPGCDDDDKWENKNRGFCIEPIEQE